MFQMVTSENIESFLLNGESETVEFKVGAKAANSVLPKLISAFANTKGGIIIYGYMEMEKSIVGTTEEDFNIALKIYVVYIKLNTKNSYSLLYKLKNQNP